MGKPLDYNGFAKTYAETRSAVPWVVNPLIREIQMLEPPASILEIGCGTGNYIIELSIKVPGNNYKGFDLSENMLNIARSRTKTVEFTHGNGDIKFPFDDDLFNAAFAVDVIHHIVNYDVFFSECNRMLKQNGIMIIVTDSEDNIRRRSGTKFFPEKLNVELDRYPKIEELNAYAHNNGLNRLSMELAEGYMELDDKHISKIERKHSSSSRLISEEAFQRGLKRVKQAKLRGEKWFSTYTILIYKKKAF